MTREEAIKILSELPDRILTMLLPFNNNYDYKGALAMAISALSENKGEWIKIKNGYKCSACGHIMDKVLSVSGNLIYQYSNYCPECGKKMT